MCPIPEGGSAGPGHLLLIYISPRGLTDACQPEADSVLGPS